jgi:WD40 repeat protein
VLAGSGGAPSGSGGAIGSGSGSCSTISTAVGLLNPCGRTTGVAYSPDGLLLASVTEGGPPYLHIWRLSDGALVREPTTSDGSVRSGGAYQVAFSPDGKLIATSGNAPTFIAADGTSTMPSTNTANLWDVATGTLVKTLPTACGFYSAGLGFSHDGARLATAGFDGNIEIWSVPGGTRLLSIPYVGSVYTAHFSPDDTRLVTASYLVATVWNATTGAKLLEITGLEDEMNETAYSPDGRMILTTADNGKVKVLDAAGSLLQDLTFKPATSPYFSHAIWIDDARFVVDDWSGAVKEWTADASGTFVESRAFAENMQTLGIAVSPDRTALVVGGSAGFVFLSP